MPEFATVATQTLITSAHENAKIDHAFEKPCSFIVRKNGSNYEAIYGSASNQAGKILGTPSSIATTVINNALNALTAGRIWQEKVVLKGDFTVTDAIQIPSYTELEILGKITMANNINKNIIQNVNFPSSSNTHITIRGGVLDHNSANNPDPGGDVWATMCLYKCEYSVINNVEIVDSVTGSMHIEEGKRNLILNNKFIGIQDPVYSWNPESLMVVRNYFADVSGMDIRIENTSSSDYGLLIIKDNIIEYTLGGVSGTGLDIYGKAISIIENNQIRNKEIGIYIGGNSSSYKATGIIIGNSLIENEDGINVPSHSYNIGINNNTFLDNTVYDIDIQAATANATSIKNNQFIGSATINDVGTGTIIKFNDGYVTENGDTATISNGTTEVTVTHGCSYTPNAEDINVHPIETLNNASFWWVDTITSTTFKIKVNADPGQDVDFKWNVQRV